MACFKAPSVVMLLSVGVCVSVSSSPAANAVTGNKLIAIHNDRNTAKIFFFTCVFLLLFGSFRWGRASGSR